LPVKRYPEQQVPVCRLTRAITAFQFSRTNRAILFGSFRDPGPAIGGDGIASMAAILQDLATYGKSSLAMLDRACGGDRTRFRSRRSGPSCGSMAASCRCARPRSSVARSCSTMARSWSQS